MMRFTALLVVAILAVTVSGCGTTPRNEKTFVAEALGGKFIPVPLVRGQPAEKIVRACGAYTYMVNRTMIGDAASRGLSDALVDLTLRAIGIAVIGRDLSDYRDSLTTNAIGAAGRGAVNGARQNASLVRNSFSRCMSVNGLPGELARR